MRRMNSVYKNGNNAQRQLQSLVCVTSCTESGKGKSLEGVTHVRGHTPEPLVRDCGARDQWIDERDGHHPGFAAPVDDDLQERPTAGGAAAQQHRSLQEEDVAAGIHTPFRGLSPSFPSFSSFTFPSPRPRHHRLSATYFARMLLFLSPSFLSHAKHARTHPRAATTPRGTHTHALHSPRPPPSFSGENDAFDHRCPRGGVSYDAFDLREPANDNKLRQH